MKFGLILAACALLGACAESPQERATIATPGLSINDVNVVIDDKAGQVTVWLTVENRLDSAIKGLSIHLVPRNRVGELIPDAHLELQAARPIKAGEVVGPVRVATSTLGHEVSCVELYHVRTALPDQSIHLVSGPETLQMVDGQPAGLCRSVTGERETG